MRESYGLGAVQMLSHHLPGRGETRTQEPVRILSAPENLNPAHIEYKSGSFPLHQPMHFLVLSCKKEVWSVCDPSILPLSFQKRVLDFL
jgi:hypothetical protein